MNDNYHQKHKVRSLVHKCFLSKREGVLYMLLFILDECHYDSIPRTFTWKYFSFCV